MNTIPYLDLAILLIAHWVGDYWLQSRDMGNNKHKSWNALTAHVIVYSGIIITAAIILHLPQPLLFGIITFFFHFSTDYFTSKLVKWLWHRKKEYWTFIVMSLDQIMHYAQLLLTYYIFKHG